MVLTEKSKKRKRKKEARRKLKKKNRILNRPVPFHPLNVSRFTEKLLAIIAN